MQGMPRGSGGEALGRPLVASLLVSSALLSIVSWYTTQQGMALYLSPWFSFLASLGLQSALVLVAWIVGVSEGRRGLLIAVYVVTATVLSGIALLLGLFVAGVVLYHTNRMARERERLATQDTLTGLPNRMLFPGSS